MYIPTEEKKITDEEFVAKFIESNSWRFADVLAWRAGEENIPSLIMTASYEGLVFYYFVAMDINGHRWYFDASGVYRTLDFLEERCDLPKEFGEFKWADSESLEWAKMNSLIHNDIDEDNGGSAEQYYLQSNFYLDEYFTLLGMGE